MNDRVSNIPPTTYLGSEEEFLDSYEYHGRDESRGRKLARSRKLTNLPNTSTIASSVGGRSESRNSGIFRFGKSIAATFNPSNWKIWSKQPQAIDEEEDTRLKTLRDRQAKAEKAYKELKESGQFLDPQNGFHKYQQAAMMKERMNSPAKHDSGVVMEASESGSGRASLETSTGDGRSWGGKASLEIKEGKRNGQVFLELPPSSTRRGESPAARSIANSNSSSPSKQSLYFKKASFSDMKRPSLANIKKAFGSSSSFLEPEDGHYPMRRIPSRKDLQKQQKLVKRVSDLEGKLETARRELHRSLGEVLPDKPPQKVGRSRFVPGALATLPSERLLSGYLDPEDGDDDEDGNEKAVTSENTKMNGLFMSEGPDDENLIGFRNIKRQPALSRENNPSPSPRKLPRDLAMQSIEGRSSLDLNANSRIVSQISEAVQTASTIGQLTKSPDPNDADYQDGDEESIKEATPESTPKAAKKKRKSFKPITDDGSRYQPSEGAAESDAESEIKMATRKKNPTARPSKLRKTSGEHGVSASPSMRSMKILPASQHPRGYRAGPTLTLTGVTLSPSRTTSGKLQKKAALSPPHSGYLIKETQRQQSASPPPSGEFIGFDTVKPIKPTTPRTRKVDGAAYVVDPAEDDVPPVPKIPKALRMPNGEMVETHVAKVMKSDGFARHSPHKIVKKRPTGQVGVDHTKQKREEQVLQEPSPTKSFEWPEDVF